MTGENPASSAPVTKVPLKPLGSVEAMKLDSELPVLEFDHLMICVPRPEAAVRALTECGLRLGGQATHRGQGTSNACFFFDNGYIELLWASNPAELIAADAISLAARVDWMNTGASPFGFSVRPTGADRDWPFRTWNYSPPFLPDGAIPIPVLANSQHLYEPLAFVSYFPGPPRMIQPAVPLQTASGLSNVTAVSIGYPDRRGPSKELIALTELGLADFHPGSALHAAELTLDGGRQGLAHSFQPEIPLLLRW